MQEAGFQATNAFTGLEGILKFHKEWMTYKCKFTCTSGKCLYLGSLVCNQQNDCGDNSDEENCLLVTEHPPPGIFNYATPTSGLFTSLPDVLPWTMYLGFPEVTW
ncbi:low-density lipoprotein receptor class A domain-containing protein 4-like [Ursus maritimus]|uniref:Low-density lipoprotein receptor class A domain-containing protein 4-like n=1 Tax=Ursus maritimus TaxID=29073 RepID=A0A8M1F0I8_URSMA|nr:low-density lipoprotein receptor class A domain-containing protein 4-like [Ursus maritimus]XP_040475546.1 low-density lipoprotein receptor class A domain-containing protein 4-like [Ursus maritimus]XP_040475547.1 low-density lipoprotein receptor class A domain-containing protein 4-like [Ursus maritimus]